MTLVLGYTCDNFVLQVSDRRLSRGGTPLPAEFNKAVVWCGLAVVGYTGFAFVDRRQRQPDDQVDEWVMRQLYGARSVQQVLDAIADPMPGWVNAMPGPWRPQAFNIVGWAPQHDGQFLPFAALVSNFHDDAGNALATTRPDAARLLQLPPPQPWFVVPVGEPLLEAEVRALRDGLDRIDADRPDRVADLLAQLVRTVAARAPERVGAQVMISCLPKPAGPLSGFFLTERRGRPNLSSPTFFYRGDDASAPIGYAPLTVCGDRGFSDIKLEYLNDSGSDVSFEVRLRGPEA